MSASSHNDDAEFLHHEPCENCGSSDAKGVWSDGHTFCFSCEAYTPPTGHKPTKAGAKVKASEQQRLLEGVPVALERRGLTLETTKRWAYLTTKYKGEPVQVAQYRDPETGAVVAQKVRFRNKDFIVLGDKKGMGLYGRHLWRDGGKRIIITEGEIDAMTVDQVMNYRWPVVSIPNGAQSARKVLAKNLDWLNKFDQVVLCFDNDDEGRAAIEKCAGLFPPGKAAVVTLPLKDANEMLQARKVKELVNALWEAREYRPDGIVTITDIKDKVLTPPEVGLPWFLPTLTKHTYGRRTGECVAVGAGTGIGKSDFIAEQVKYDLIDLKQPVAVFLFEQTPAESAKIIASKIANKRFYIPDAGWTQDELKETVEQLAQSRLYLYDHFGVTDWDVIRERIRFLAHSEGVKLFYLDHLTALATGQGDDERVELERIMAEIGSLVKELDIWMLFVSHLATPDGTPHEEGGRVMIRHFKGSRAIGFWSHVMLGMERDQQAADDEDRRTTTIRILKERLTGLATGQTMDVIYNPITGRLTEVEHSDKDDEDDEQEESF